jgi:hypothetical protein
MDLVAEMQNAMGVTVQPKLPWMRSIDRANGGRTMSKWQKQSFGKSAKAGAFGNANAHVSWQQVKSTPKRRAPMRTKVNDKPRIAGYVKDGVLYADAARTEVVIVLNKRSGARDPSMSLNAMMQELASAQACMKKL